MSRKTALFCKKNFPAGHFQLRSRRAAYWYVVLMTFIIGIVLSLLAYAVPSLSILSSIYGLASLIPSIAICVRRLHDIGKSGWWYLLIFVPLVGAIILLVWFIREGDHGDNLYGPDPKTTVVL